MDVEKPSETGIFSWKIIGASIATAVGVISGAIAIYSFVTAHPRCNVSGDWTITNKIESTSYHPFQGLALGYRVTFIQDGANISGSGEKWSENNKWLEPRAHTHITIKGIANGGHISATFEEDGAVRKTVGTLEWTYQSSPERVTGSFTSTAANSRGSSAGERTPR
jgi:hypothetical protein